MKMGLVPSLAVLLFLAVCADSARNGFMPIENVAEGNYPLMDDSLVLHELKEPYENEVLSSEGLPTEFCHLCLDFSRKAKKILSDPNLFKEIDNLAAVLCGLVSPDLKPKCIKMVERYKYEAVMLLQEVVREDKFCNSTGFCPNNPQESFLSTSSKANLLSAMEHFNEMLSKMQKDLPMELTSNATCNVCHSVLDKIHNALEDPDKQLKFITSLLKACETEAFIYRCKKLVFAYGPIVISNLQKIVSMDLCHMVHLCKDPRNQTDHMNLVSMEQSRRHPPSTIAQLYLI
uniref:Proactivator polypeptide-like 1 n=1 Tax=Anthurium amnicola TaxID=1678845 RepID=A0A1D1XWR5_9ARAE